MKTHLSGRCAGGLLLAALMVGGGGDSAADASVAFSEIGYDALVAELGAATPTGAGVKVSMVEASWDGRSSNYAPDWNSPAFAGKTFAFKSGTPTASLHATEVGNHWFALNTSMTPGITQIDSYYAADWRSDYLRTGSTSAPSVETSQVQNHSWSSTSASSEVLRRLDYAINRDGFTAVVALHNWDLQGSTPSHRPLMGSGYNGITVGLSSGKHTRGTTTIDGSGRIKPDLVAPDSATSYATPTVGSAASLLRDAAGREARLANGLQPETVKAVLMAGATKDEFAGQWDRTATRPLDEVYGAGELNVHRSYHILAAGEQEAGGDIGERGWDFGATSLGGRSYFFNVTQDTAATELSALLTWNRQVAASGTFGWLSPSSSMANLDLALVRLVADQVVATIDISRSLVDNVEHIYLDGPLSAGDYALTVSSATAGVEYALAWYGQGIPEPATLVVLLAGLGWRRRR